MAKLKATEFISEEQLKDAFGVLHEIATDQGKGAQDRIGASYALIEHCREPDYYPTTDATGQVQWMPGEAEAG